MEGEVSVDMGDIVVERRARFGQAYVQLRQCHTLCAHRVWQDHANADHQLAITTW